MTRPLIQHHISNELFVCIQRYMESLPHEPLDAAIAHARRIIPVTVSIVAQAEMDTISAGAGGQFTWDDATNSYSVSLVTGSDSTLMTSNFLHEFGHLEYMDSVGYLSDATPSADDLSKFALHTEMFAQHAAIHTAASLGWERCLCAGVLCAMQMTRAGDPHGTAARRVVRSRLWNDVVTRLIARARDG